MDTKPQLLKQGIVACQVCVPTTWTQQQIEDWLNEVHPTGISSRWSVPTPEEYAEYNKDPLRVPCNERADCTHTVLYC